MPPSMGMLVMDGRLRLPLLMCPLTCPFTLTPGTGPGDVCAGGEDTVVVMVGGRYSLMYLGIELW